MTLREKLEKLKNLQEQNTEADWEKYKEAWKNSIEELLHVIMDKWFDDYQEKKLMEFSLIPIKRIDPYIGEYVTSMLEITLPSNKYLVLQPVTGVTAEYDGKLEFYMMGDIDKKVTILRKILDDKSYEWIIATSQHSKDHHKLDKAQIEKFIDQWLQ